ncbi:MAG: ATP-binding protein [Bacteroidota bacterium]
MKHFIIRYTILIFVFFVFWQDPLHSQTIKLDLEYFKKLPSDEKLKNEINKLDYTLKNWNSIPPDSTLNIVKLFLEKSEALCACGVQGYFQSLLGDIYKAMGDLSSSSKYYFNALEHYNNIDDTLNSIRLLTAIGDMYRAAGSLDKSLMFLYLAEKKSYSAKIADHIPYIQARLASTFFELNFADSSAWTLTNSRYLFFQEINDKEAGLIKNNLLFFYANSSLSAAKLIGDTSLIIENLNLLGAFYRINSKYDKSILYYKEALFNLEKFKKSNYKPLILTNLSNVYLLSGNVPEAKKYSLLAYDEAFKSRIKVYEWMALGNLQTIYEKNNEYRQAYIYSQIKDTLTGQLYNEKSTQQINELQNKYETDIKNSEIYFLKHENEQNTRSQLLLIIFFIIAIIVFALIILVIYLRLQNARQKRKIAEEEKIHKELLLKESEMANHARNEFFANVSHEIRTPLNSILGFSELLQEKIHGPEYKQFLSGIISSGKSLLGLMSDIMDLSKIEAGKLVILNEHVDIVELCNDVTKLFSFNAEEKGLKISINTDLLSHRYFILDEVRLRQILLNLIGNSLKYTYEGMIEVSLHNVPVSIGHDKLTITVRDSGIGISAEQKNLIFTPFQQVSEKHSRVFGGTGLGLSISKKLIELMNGSITFESEAGKGSVFDIILKNIERSVPTEPKFSLASEHLNKIIFNKSSILIVEDNEANRAVIRAYLTTYNFNIKEACNGAEAIEMLYHFFPDLILMDIQMPVMDGNEAIIKIRGSSKFSKIPVIALTAGVVSETEANLSNIFNGVLFKPICRNNLLDEIKKFIPYTETEDNDFQIPENTSNFSDIKPEQLAYLSSILYPRWKETTVLLSNDEIEEFAANVQAFALENNISGLTEWSKSVLLFSKTFNIKQLYETYNKFPSLVNKYKQ